MSNSSDSGLNSPLFDYKSVPKFRSSSEVYGFYESNSSPEPSAALDKKINYGNSTSFAPEGMKSPSIFSRAIVVGSSIPGDIDGEAIDEEAFRNVRQPTQKLPPAAQVAGPVELTEDSKYLREEERPQFAEKSVEASHIYGDGVRNKVGHRETNGPRLLNVVDSKRSSVVSVPNGKLLAAFRKRVSSLRDDDDDFDEVSDIRLRGNNPQVAAVVTGKVSTVTEKKLSLKNAAIDKSRAQQAKSSINAPVKDQSVKNSPTIHLSSRATTLDELANEPLDSMNALDSVVGSHSNVVNQTETVRDVLIENQIRRNSRVNTSNVQPGLGPDSGIGKLIRRDSSNSVATGVSGASSLINKYTPVVMPQVFDYNEAGSVASFASFPDVASHTPLHSTQLATTLNMNGVSSHVGFTQVAGTLMTPQGPMPVYFFPSNGSNLVFGPSVSATSTRATTPVTLNADRSNVATPEVIPLQYEESLEEIRQNLRLNSLRQSSQLSSSYHIEPPRHINLNAVQTDVSTRSSAIASAHSTDQFLSDLKQKAADLLPKTIREVASEIFYEKSRVFLGSSTSKTTVEVISSPVKPSGEDLPSTRDDSSNLHAAPIMKGDSPASAVDLKSSHDAQMDPAQAVSVSSSVPSLSTFPPPQMGSSSLPSPKHRYKSPPSKLHELENRPPFDLSLLEGLSHSSGQFEEASSLLSSTFSKNLNPSVKNNEGIPTGSKKVSSRNNLPMNSRGRTFHSESQSPSLSISGSVAGSTIVSSSNAPARPVPRVATLNDKKAIAAREERARKELERARNRGPPPRSASVSSLQARSSGGPVAGANASASSARTRRHSLGSSLTISRSHSVGPNSRDSLSAPSSSKISGFSISPSLLPYTSYSSIDARRLEASEAAYDALQKSIESLGASDPRNEEGSRSNRSSVGTIDFKRRSLQRVSNDSLSRYPRIDEKPRLFLSSDIAPEKANSSLNGSKKGPTIDSLTKSITSTIVKAAGLKLSEAGISNSNVKTFVRSSSGSSVRSGSNGTASSSGDVMGTLTSRGSSSMLKSKSSLNSILEPLVRNILRTEIARSKSMGSPKRSHSVPNDAKGISSFQRSDEGGIIADSEVSNSPSSKVPSVKRSSPSKAIISDKQNGSSSPLEDENLLNDSEKKKLLTKVLPIHRKLRELNNRANALRSVIERIDGLVAENGLTNSSDALSSSEIKNTNSTAVSNSLQSSSTTTEASLSRLQAELELNSVSMERSLLLSELDMLEKDQLEKLDHMFRKELEVASTPSPRLRHSLAPSSSPSTRLSPKKVFTDSSGFAITTTTFNDSKVVLSAPSMTVPVNYDPRTSTSKSMSPSRGPYGDISNFNKSFGREVEEVESVRSLLQAHMHNSLLRNQASIESLRVPGLVHLDSQQDPLLRRARNPILDGESDPELDHEIDTVIEEAGRLTARAKMPLEHLSDSARLASAGIENVRKSSYINGLDLNTYKNVTKEGLLMSQQLSDTLIGSISPYRQSPSRHTNDLMDFVDGEKALMFSQGEPSKTLDLSASANTGDVNIDERRKIASATSLLKGGDGKVCDVCLRLPAMRECLECSSGYCSMCFSVTHGDRSGERFGHVSAPTSYAIAVDMRGSKDGVITPKLSGRNSDHGLSNGSSTKLGNSEGGAKNTGGNMSKDEVATIALLQMSQSHDRLHPSVSTNESVRDGTDFQFQTQLQPSKRSTSLSSVEFSSMPYPSGISFSGTSRSRIFSPSRVDLFETATKESRKTFTPANKNPNSGDSIKEIMSNARRRSIPLLNSTAFNVTARPTIHLSAPTPANSFNASSLNLSGGALRTATKSDQSNLIGGYNILDLGINSLTQSINSNYPKPILPASSVPSISYDSKSTIDSIVDNISALESARLNLSTQAVDLITSKSEGAVAPSCSSKPGSAVSKSRRGSQGSMSLLKSLLHSVDSPALTIPSSSRAAGVVTPTRPTESESLSVSLGITDNKVIESSTLNGGIVPSKPASLSLSTNEVDYKKNSASTKDSEKVEFSYLDKSNPVVEEDITESFKSPNAMSYLSQVRNNVISDEEKLKMAADSMSPSNKSSNTSIHSLKSTFESHVRKNSTGASGSESPSAGGSTSVARGFLSNASRTNSVSKLYLSNVTLSASSSGAPSPTQRPEGRVASGFSVFGQLKRQGSNVSKHTSSQTLNRGEETPDNSGVSVKGSNNSEVVNSAAVTRNGSTPEEVIDSDTLPLRGEVTLMSEKVQVLTLPFNSSRPSSPTKSTLSSSVSLSDTCPPEYVPQVSEKTLTQTLDSSSSPTVSEAPRNVPEEPVQLHANEEDKKVVMKDEEPKSVLKQPPLSSSTGTAQTSIAASTETSSTTKPQSKFGSSTYKSSYVPSSSKPFNINSMIKEATKQTISAAASGSPKPVSKWAMNRANANASSTVKSTNTSGISSNSTSDVASSGGGMNYLQVLKAKKEAKEKEAAAAAAAATAASAAAPVTLTSSESETRTVEADSASAESSNTPADTGETGTSHNLDVREKEIYLSDSSNIAGNPESSEVVVSLTTRTDDPSNAVIE